MHPPSQKDMDPPSPSPKQGVEHINFSQGMSIIVMYPQGFKSPCLATRIRDEYVFNKYVDICVDAMFENPKNYTFADVHGILPSNVLNNIRSLFSIHIIHIFDLDFETY